MFSLYFRFIVRIIQRTVFPDDIIKAQHWEKQMEQKGRDMNQSSESVRANTPETVSEEIIDNNTSTANGGYLRDNDTKVVYRNGRHHHKTHKPKQFVTSIT